jgi:hypothetical protein
VDWKAARPLLPTVYDGQIVDEESSSPAPALREPERGVDGQPPMAELEV